MLKVFTHLTLYSGTPGGSDGIAPAGIEAAGIVAIGVPGGGGSEAVGDGGTDAGSVLLLLVPKVYMSNAVSVSSAAGTPVPICDSALAKA